MNSLAALGLTLAVFLLLGVPVVATLVRVFLVQTEIAGPARQQEVVTYVTERTDPHDTVLVWGANTVVNFLADRRSPTQFHYGYPLIVPDELSDEYILEAVRDLERIGDEAKKIAKLALKLTEEGPAPRGYFELRHIGAAVSEMLHDALDAFTRLDVDAALEVVRRDKTVDQEYRSATRELVTYMMEDPRNITFCIHLLFCAKNIERIGDHATNIAETVHYVITGVPLTDERPKKDTTSTTPVEFAPKD